MFALFVRIKLVIMKFNSESNDFGEPNAEFVQVICRLNFYAANFSYELFHKLHDDFAKLFLLDHCALRHLID